jgi:hypothetical protein
MGNPSGNSKRHQRPSQTRQNGPRATQQPPGYRYPSRDRRRPRAGRASRPTNGAPHRQPLEPARPTRGSSIRQTPPTGTGPRHRPPPALSPPPTARHRGLDPLRRGCRHLPPASTDARQTPAGPPAGPRRRPPRRHEPLLLSPSQALDPLAPEVSPGCQKSPPIFLAPPPTGPNGEAIGGLLGPHWGVIFQRLGKFGLRIWAATTEIWTGFGRNLDTQPVRCPKK